MWFLLKNNLKAIRNFKLQFFIVFFIWGLALGIVLGVFSNYDSRSKLFNNLKTNTNLDQFVVSFNHNINDPYYEDKIIGNLNEFHTLNAQLHQNNVIPSDINIVNPDLEALQNNYQSNTSKFTEIRREFTFKYSLLDDETNKNSSYINNVFTLLTQSNNIDGVSRDLLNANGQLDDTDDGIYDVYVSKYWATTHHLKIDSIFNLYSLKFKIVNWVNSAALFNNVNEISALDNFRNSTSIILSEKDFYNIAQILPISSFNNNTYLMGNFLTSDPNNPLKVNLSDSEIKNIVNNINNYLSNNPNNNYWNDFYEWNSLSSLITLRSALVGVNLKNQNYISFAICLILILITLLLIAIVTKKQIDSNRLTIGVLKSHGYRSIDVGISWVATSVAIAIGSIIVAIVVGFIVAIIYRSFNMGLAQATTNPTINLTWPIVAGMFVGSAIIISLLNFGVTVFSLRESAVRLLVEKQKFALGYKGSLAMKMLKWTPFLVRFGISSLIAAGFRTLILFLIILLGSILILFGLYSTNLINNTLDRARTATNFNFSYAFNGTTLNKNVFNKIDINDSGQTSINDWYNTQTKNPSESNSFVSGTLNLNGEFDSNNYAILHLISYSSDNKYPDPNTITFLTENSIQAEGGHSAGRFLLSSDSEHGVPKDSDADDYFEHIPPSFPINTEELNQLRAYFRVQPTLKLNFGGIVYDSNTDLLDYNFSPVVDDKVNKGATNPVSPGVAIEIIPHEEVSKIDKYWKDLPNGMQDNFSNPTWGNESIEQHKIPVYISYDAAKSYDVNIGDTLPIDFVNLFPRNSGKFGDDNNNFSLLYQYLNSTPENKEWLDGWKFEIAGIYHTYFINEIFSSGYVIDDFYRSLFEYSFSEPYFNVFQNQATSSALLSQNTENYLLGGKNTPAQSFLVSSGVAGQFNSNIIVGLFDKKTLLDSFAEQVTIINVSLLIFTIIYIVVGAMGIINLNSIIIQENRSAIAVLKVLGYKSFNINLMYTLIYIPGIIILFVAACFVVIEIFNFLLNFIFNKTGLLIDPGFNINVFLIAFAVILGVYLVSIFIIQRLVKKVGYLRILNSN